MLAVLNFSPMPRTDNKDRMEVADRLHSAAIHLLRYARKQDVLTREGPARLSALSVLVFGGPMTLGQLAAAEQVKPPTMSRIVAGLERSGLARIDADARDARRIRVSVTAKGERLLQQARERRVRLLAEVLDEVSGQETEVLREASEIIERVVRGATKK
jgi:DNA-binding MarR family transcriptional regulator